jgi:hypothetical protein
LELDLLAVHFNQPVQIEGGKVHKPGYGKEPCAKLDANGVRTLGHNFKKSNIVK